MKKLRIGTRLLITIVALCGIAVGMMAYLSSTAARAILEEQGRARLQSVLDAQQESLLATLDALHDSVISQSISPVALSALTTFIGAWQALPGDKTDYLQTRYVIENEYPPGQKQLLDYTIGRDAYNRAHRKYQPYYRSIMENNGYADIYLLDGEGNVLFSVMKGEDYAANLRAGPYVSTGLARAYERVMAGDTSVDFIFEDFLEYPAPGGVYSAFMATPVLASNDAIVGVFIARVDASALAQGGASNRALGDTGTAIAVGPDHLIRRTTEPEKSPGQIRVRDETVDPVVSALRGERGVLTTNGIDSAEALAAYAPLEFYGATWGIAAQQETAELYSSATRLRRSTLTQGGFLIGIASLIALLLARSIGKPLMSVRTAMQQVAAGDYQTEVPETARQDEIGDIAETLDAFRLTLLDARKVEEKATFQGVALESATACLMIVDPDLTVRHANQAAVRLLEQHKQSIREFAPDFDARQIESRDLGSFLADAPRIARYLQDHSLTENTIDLTLGDARLALTVQIVFGADNSCRGAVIEWRDETQDFRKSALIRSIDLRQCLVEFDLHGKLTAANENFLAAMQNDLAEVVGKSVEELIVIEPRKVTHPKGFLTGILEAGSIWGQFQIRGNAKQPLWIDGGISVIADNNGAPLSLVMIGNDVSKARAAMQQANSERARVEAAQKMVVAELGAQLSRLSEGDLTVAITTPFDGEYERLRDDFNTAVGSLLRTMRSLAQTTHLIQRDATEVSSAADNIHLRTKTQAETLAVTATEIGQLADSVTSGAERARSTSRLVLKTRENAVASGSVVEDAITAMGEIEQSSKTIANITKVIDDIAFQTNLLALNAGVEAARAGDAGRGFAVVASEVRALAQRSSEAAREINSVISDANTQIARGVNLVGAAGNALGEIFEAVKGIAENVGEIADSASAQSASLGEISASVGELDRATRSNSARLAETTAAGHALRKEADLLAEANAQFDIGDGAEGDGAPFGADTHAACAVNVPARKSA